MSEVRCPICRFPIVEHEEGDQLDMCVARALGWTHHGRGIWKDPQGAVKELPCFSEDVADAHFLMEDIWEIDETAAIFNDRVSVIWKYEDWYTQSFKGATFCVRVCQAFLWLKAKEREEKNHDV